MEIQKKLFSDSYYNERIDKVSGKRASVDMLVLHCSAYPTDKLIQVFKDLEVSSHYIIDVDGTITQLVPESKRAWHAGKGYWRGITDVNSHSIGIEVINPSLGHSVAYTPAAIDSLISLSKRIISDYAILPQNIFAHSDMAPTRKYDPGRLFPWKELAQEGIGLWPGEDRVKETKTAILLQKIGYDIENEPATVRAFIRHFMPELIPDKENPMMDQYQFLVGYQENLPEVLKSQPQVNAKIIQKLQQVAFAFE